MPIIGEWKNPAITRCHGKARYPSMAIAEKVAQRDSEHTGELIVAYKCYDCARFHVGHADFSQLIARKEQEARRVELPTSCPRCGGPITEERRIAAVESGNSNVYCSSKCQAKHAKTRRNALRMTQRASRDKQIPIR